MVTGIINSIENFNPQMMMSLYVIVFYLVLFLLFLFFRLGVLIGYLKGNAIKVSKNQFAEIHQIVVNQAELLGLTTTPKVYILQSGGVLNAFAASFMGSNYIVLYSEIVESSLEQDKNILSFVIGHELGHIKRKHMVKNLLLWPSFIIPFLGAAYSRACEYTCDNIGHALAPEGTQNGLLLLASGKKIFKKVNLKEFLNQEYTEDGFWKWFSEKVSTHPNLTKRLIAFKDQLEFKKIAEPVVMVEKKEEDHSKYMPN